MRTAAEIDLAKARRDAEGIRDMLDRLRARHDLARFEYTTRLRIAPGEVPHSHPVLTLNTRLRDEDGLLSAYLHEQMHWYVTWFAQARAAAWRAIETALGPREAGLPVGFPEGAGDLASSRLHLVVNWLEVEALSVFLGQERARAIAAANFVYSGITRIVLADWDALGELYRRHGLAPIRTADALDLADLALAARTG
jgi:hypothetical protein